MTNPATVLELPKPRWVSDDVAMLYDMAAKFLEAEIAPRYDEFEKAEIFDRESWKKAGENGLLCASMPKSSAARAAPSPMRARSSRRSPMLASTASASRCTTPSSRPTSFTTAPRSRRRDGCRRWRPAS